VFAGTIRDSGGASSSTGGSLVLDGSGSLELSGTDTYNGGTTVEDGRLILATPGALEDGSSLTVGNPSEVSDLVLAARGAAASAGAAAPVPEPATLALLIAGLVVGLGVWQTSKGN
jgi:autotransporter-associated beta strand protein